MELSRRHDGGIGIAGMADRYDKSFREDGNGWGTFFALTYTYPRKTLQLTGAPKTQWCKTYPLPERPWGNAADDAFNSPEPARHPADQHGRPDERNRSSRRVDRRVRQNRQPAGQR
jgi:hypothetical protein